MSTEIKLTTETEISAATVDAYRAVLDFTREQDASPDDHTILRRYTNRFPQFADDLLAAGYARTVLGWRVTDPIPGETAEIDPSPGEASPFGEPISVYTRAQAQALADGQLVDVSAMAAEAGITFPVALTAALHADVKDVPLSMPWQSYEGRLWDCLWMLRMAITGRIRSEGDDRTKCFELTMHVGRRTWYRVKSVCGPGDEMEPVITLMRVGED